MPLPRDLGPDFLVLFSSGSRSLDLKSSLFYSENVIICVKNDDVFTKMTTFSQFDQKSCHLKTFFSRKDDVLRDREEKRTKFLEDTNLPFIMVLETVVLSMFLFLVVQVNFGYV